MKTINNFDDLFDWSFTGGVVEEKEVYKPYAFIGGKIFWGLPYQFSDGTFRPQCINDGCENPVGLSNGSLSDPKGRTLRTVCNPCHKAGYKNKPLPENVTAHKKSFCENVDGRLGFVCTTTIRFSGQLELDHIDGDHINNTPENVQTLCKDCHAIKSWTNGDYRQGKRQ